MYRRKKKTFNLDTPRPFFILYASLKEIILHFLRNDYSYTFYLFSPSFIFNNIRL